MKLRVRLPLHTGDVIVTDIEIPDGAHVQAVELLANRLPLVRLPLHIHGDSRRYHTICRRQSPDVDEVGW